MFESGIYFFGYASFEVSGFLCLRRLRRNELRLYGKQKAYLWCNGLRLYVKILLPSIKYRIPNRYKFLDG